MLSGLRGNGRHRVAPIARLAADVGAMAAATARHGKFMASELYGPLVAMEPAEGWARLDSKPPSGGEAVTWLCLDVEMCERRRDSGPRGGATNNNNN